MAEPKIKYGKIRRVNQESSTKDSKVSAKIYAEAVKKTRDKASTGTPVTNSSNKGKRVRF